MEIKNLEQDKRISDLEEFKADLFNTLYPVGSVYLTFSSSFDPNGVFTGTWKKNDTAGYALVGANDPNGGSGITSESNDRLLINSGGTQGEVKHTLTTNEMPKHTHNANSLIFWTDGLQNVLSSGNSNWKIQIKDLPTAGGSQPHNNIQPSIGVYIWHRTA